MNAGPNLIAINVGNSRVQIGAFADGELTHTERFEHRDLASAVQRIIAWWREIESRPLAAIVVASVNGVTADRLVSAVSDQLSVEVFRVGDDLPIPIGTQLDPETITGVDRLLNAAAVFDTLRQACIIVDAGTAVTVDFVDGEGTFHGGAIAPGARMQLQAMHDHTEALPDLIFAEPDADAFGRSTAQAMLRGVYHGIRGMVWKMVERYAEAYGAYPTIIATGGDAEALFHADELIDRIVPDLTLRGIMVTAKAALAGRTDEDAKKN